MLKGHFPDRIHRRPGNRRSAWKSFIMASACGPTNEQETGRSRPPIMISEMPTWSASSAAIFRALVMTVSDWQFQLLQVPRDLGGGRSRVQNDGFSRLAQARPQLSRSEPSRCGAGFPLSAGENLVLLPVAAPLRRGSARRRRSEASASRSLRTVTAEIENRLIISATVT